VLSTAAIHYTADYAHLGEGGLAEAIHRSWVGCRLFIRMELPLQFIFLVHLCGLWAIIHIISMLANSSFQVSRHFLLWYMQEDV